MSHPEYRLKSHCQRYMEIDYNVNDDDDYDNKKAVLQPIFEFQI